MKLYRVEWPDGEVIIVMAADEEELFVTLDEFGNPFAATIEEIEPMEPIILKSDGTKWLEEFPYRVVRIINEKVLDEVMGGSLRSLKRAIPPNCPILALLYEQNAGHYS